MFCILAAHHLKHKTAAAINSFEILHIVQSIKVDKKKLNSKAEGLMESMNINYGFALPSLYSQ